MGLAIWYFCGVRILFVKLSLFSGPEIKRSCPFGEWLRVAKNQISVVQDPNHL